MLQRLRVRNSFPRFPHHSLLLQNRHALLKRYLSTPSSPSSPGYSSTPKGRSILDLWLLGGAGFLISLGLILQSLPTAEEPEPDGSSTFKIPVVSQTGAQSTKTLSMLSQAEVNARLTEHAASYAMYRPGNPVVRYDTAALPSNSPIEDDSCTIILERDPSKNIGNVNGDLAFWGVFDGHSGWQTSKTLANTLITYVAKELELVFQGAPKYQALIQPKEAVDASESNATWAQYFRLSTKPIPVKEPLDTHNEVIHSALQNAFESLDADILNAPIKLLSKLQETPAAFRKQDLPSSTEALNTLLPAVSGSCALLAFLDSANNKLHVACTGDSRAVMGTWNAEHGKWVTDELSVDLTAENKDEVERLRSEHPGEDGVVSRGRILGGLQPSRAFGDARYKWPMGIQEQLEEAFYPGSMKRRPRNYLTPPYVTSRPQVYSVDLAAQSTALETTGGALAGLTSLISRPTIITNHNNISRFVVLATDGLYDRLSSEEVVALVGSHLSGTRGIKSRDKVLTMTVPSKSPLPNAVSSPHAGPTEKNPVFTFEDSNLSTHLIRNALGGAQREKVSALLSIPAPLSRRYRDDMTVVVLLFGDNEDNGVGIVRGGAGSNGVMQRDVEEPIKAKL